MRIYIAIVATLLALALQIEIAGPGVAGDHSGHVYANAQMGGN